MTDPFHLELGIFWQFTCHVLLPSNTIHSVKEIRYTVLAIVFQSTPDQEFKVLMGSLQRHSHSRL